MLERLEMLPTSMSAASQRRMTPLRRKESTFSIAITMVEPEIKDLSLAKEIQ
jgi:hypothetical protein